jgi:hypothetical protein
MPDGPVAITVNHTSSAGVPAVQISVNVMKDSMLPTVSVNAGFVTNTNKGSYPLSGSCSEIGRPVSISGPVSGTTSCSGGGTWFANMNYSAQADGSIVVTAQQSDAAGNTSAPGSATLTKDTAAPSLTITSSATISQSNVTSYPLGGTCSELGVMVIYSGAVSGSMLCTAGVWSTSVNFSSASEGTVTVSASQTDAAGNVASTSVSLTKNTTTPSVSINPTTITSINQTAVALSGSCSQNGQPVMIGGPVGANPVCTSGTWNTVVNYTAQSDGTVSITADHSDGLGNNAVQATASLPKDTALPNVFINTNTINNSNKSAYVLTGTCSENGRTVNIGGAVSTTAPCVLGAWSVTVNFSAQSDGAVYVTADLNDAAGNNAIQSAINLSKDTSPPTVAITSTAAVTTANQFGYSVNGTCSEPGATVVIGGSIATTVMCNVGSWGVTLNYSAVGDGPSSVLVTADLIDNAGNQATQAVVNLLKDTTYPSIAITSSAAINLANQSSYPLMGTCSENGRTITISGGVTTTCTSGSWSANIDYSIASDGVIAVTADLSDAAGNNNQAATNIPKDTSIPSVSVAGGPTLYINWTSLNLNGSCSEPGQTVYITGSGSTTTFCSSGTWTATVNIVSDGAYSYYIDLSDSAGNSATQASINVQRDTVPPSVTITSNAIIHSGNAGSYPLQGTCETGATINVTAPVTASMTCTAGSWSASMDYSSLSDGSYTVSVNATDMAGNVGSTSTSLTKNTVAATVSVNSGGPYINSSNQNSFGLFGSCSGNGQNVFISGAATGNTVCSANAWSVYLDLSANGEGNQTFYVDHSTATQASILVPKDTVPPMANISGYPAGNSPDTFLNVMVNGSGVTHYKYKVGVGSLDCTSPGGYSSPVAVATYITDDIEDIPPGSARVCVLGIDIAGNIQGLGAATTANWTRIINHTIFLTSGTYTGNLGGTAGADQKCQTEANSNSLPGYWRALISISGRNAADIPIMGPVYNTQSQPIANSKADLWDNSITNGVMYDQYGMSQGGRYVHTGSNSAGMSTATSDCTGYTNSASGNSTVGSASANTSAWFTSTTQTCATAASIYCVNRVTSDDPILKAAMGTNDGEIAVTITTPATLTMFDHFELRRDSGTFAPTCDGGTIMESGYSLAPSTDYNYTHYYSAGTFHSYRVCVYDSSNRLTNDFAVFRAARSKGGALNYKRAFVTTAIGSGNRSGLTGMDSACNSAASTAGLGGTWKVIASDNTTSAKDRLTVPMPILNMAGQTVAVDYADLWDGTISSPIQYDQVGAQKGAGVLVWTGSDAAGVLTASSCSGWTSTASSGSVGSVSATGQTWIKTGTPSTCSTATLAQYCLEQ